jgi:hypothetical protein
VTRRSLPGTDQLPPRVIRVLDHLSRYYDGKKVRIAGVRLDDTGLPVEHLEVLVRIDALSP